MRLFTQRVSLIFFEAEIMMKHADMWGTYQNGYRLHRLCFMRLNLDLLKVRFIVSQWEIHHLGNRLRNLVGGLEHFLFSIIYGMSSFPLTFIFFRWVETTNQGLCFFWVI